ncbi:MAG: phenylalanine--tRNA ligase subunit alpha, partial [Evtepia sp.]
MKREALAALEQTQAVVDLETLRVKYLGKKGELTA